MQQKGPHNSLVVFQLQTLIQKFTEIWSGTERFDNEINRKLIKQEIFPMIEEEIRERVDQIMKRELDNYYFQLNITRRKEKRAKRKRRGKNKGKKVPGEKLVTTKNPVDLVSEVIETNILKKNRPVRFQDFIGVENITR